MLPPALPPIVIEWDGGGYISDYLDRAAEMRGSGRMVRFRGACHSACTLYLALLPKAQICAEPKAEFWFHSPYLPPDRKPAPETQAWMMSVYPKAIRAWIDQRGGLTPKWTVLRGHTMRKLVPLCET